MAASFPFELEDYEGLLIDIFDTCSMMYDMDWVIDAAMRCALKIDKTVPLLEIAVLCTKMNEDQMKRFGSAAHATAMRLLQAKLGQGMLNSQEVDLDENLAAQLICFAQLFFRP